MWGQKSSPWGVSSTAKYDETRPSGDNSNESGAGYAFGNEPESKRGGKPKGNKVAPMNFREPPQVKPKAAPGTFMDEDLDHESHYGSSLPPVSPNSLERGPSAYSPAASKAGGSNMGEGGGGKKQGSPVLAHTRRLEAFQVESENPYSTDFGAQLGHGTQYAIDSLNEEIDEQMA